ncbi:hypothetical protein BCR34DRAFT_621678 [Clohesyomyces aquaticus]|uniref:Uncharacterized protein n=1 Tax=Clohesyomyces aquaticus TaxID=1231657 RepID=A0A1Y2A6E1_9PLEO|nr:hypothetical protein BCR34DRAFT_621678 [Clohesyomyces aquaticus]
MPHALSQGTEIPSFEGEKLYVNDGLLRHDQIGSLKQSSPDMPIDELRRRYNEDGYLFLKALLPREDVLRARAAYFTMLEPSGVLKPGTTTVEGIFDPAKDKEDFPGIGAGAAGGNGKPGGATAERFVDLALESHYTEWYKEAFCKHPGLKEMVARLTGWAIGVHHDQIFLRHGEPTSLTAWCSMGDIGLTGGGFIYLENGHTLGREVEAEFASKARECGLSDEKTKNAFNQNMLSTGLLADGPSKYSDAFGRRWLTHASTLNYDPDNVIRVGTDLRFVDSSKPWDTRWNKDSEFNNGI